MQHTVSRIIELSGVGLHSGAETVLRLLPAEIGTGLVFRRVDVTDRDNMIPARWDSVVDTRLCTVVANQAGVSVGTIEHLMAALSACGVDNAVLELDAPEVPIMDGSSAPFVDAINEAGLKTQAAPRRAIKVLKEVSVVDGDKIVTLKPGIGSRFKAGIDFAHPSIGQQSFEIELFSGDFETKISDARTFGFAHEAKALRAMGLALGGSMDNAVVLDEKAVMNPEGLRHSDEFARHKVLDAVGDIYIAGGPMIGHYEASKPGHNMNNRVLQALFADSQNWEWCDIYMNSVSSPPATHNIEIIPVHGIETEKIHINTVSA
ncbi:MAG: UDP-3-O-[3-hydroxymyristoyl] N-acetylglucosamine deacetylase [Alphaproteobacteria bacterium RIFCSPHIGHO2_12_FULL_45_9]|nr:MAG: UDP-3-O-[3-hydroxymyristoyl] N-acetylglucosamine deacetylase [Alphaproteobacteria bacterium RIFCSPHIGHO2_02_FULL_46_13]OFW96480.1 MAG: UDP-3-O-[3-hydroxymyristoyl] N-acetylglucosamine deacetylase [Alphaproteobacteria bacterium RIFCSPHIGHO2_12_FULL_45_9]